MLGSVLFWEAVTFAVLMAGLFLFYPRVRRWKARARAMARGSESSTARETLDRRYAEGEISREEYLTIKKDMTKRTEEEHAG